jgi:hypothetical protein
MKPLNMEIYFNNFIENGFEHISLLKNINDEDLIDIGIQKLGHRKLILKQISQLSDIKE